jgi:Domain of unknown function (DUF4304)
MSSQQSPRLEGAIKNFLAPALREDKFGGSGRTYRRQIDGLIQVVNVQGSRSGGSFAINLAFHPVAIPDVLGHQPDPKRLTESLCEFRRRLAEGNGDKWWNYESTLSSMETAMRDAAEFYIKRGRPLLNRVAGPNGLVALITAEQLDSDSFDLAGFRSTKTRMALALARLRASQGRHGDARAFAKIGLKDPPGMPALATELREIAGQT